MTVAVYAGTFDPITNGHLDIAVRASRIFDKLIIGVYDATAGKTILFNTKERVALVKKSVKDYPNIEVQPFTGMVVAFARKTGAQTMVRGLRMSTDFEREFEMALMNKKLDHELELVCLMTSLQYQFVSSSLLKEVTALGGDIESLVPKHVAKALKEKFSKKK
ncbi:MAG: pantetheine-phosphate adenylyltransferase [Dehalococcoidales bacterium]|nr:pantetheine-phosphate adenylyltransferase [Dehalococcoidales bacterium]